MRTLVIVTALSALLGCGAGDTPEDHLAKARAYLHAGDTAAATIELQNALQKDGNRAEARWLLGQQSYAAGDILAAEKEILRAQELGWTADDVRPALSRTLLAQGKFADVLALDYRPLAAPAASVVLANQALAALSQGDRQAPLQLAALAREKDPQALEARLAEATVAVHLRAPQQALELADAILASSPTNAEASWIRGQALLRLGRLEEARSALDHSIDHTDATNLTYRIARALVNLQLQDYDAAQLDADELLKLAPRNPAANYVQGALDFHARQYRKATTPLGLAEPIAQQFPLTLYFLGAAYLVEQDLKAAEEFASRFVAAQPDDSHGRKLLAVILMQAGKPAQAKSTLQPVLDGNQNDIVALNILANAMLLDDQADLGLVLYARIKQLSPNWPIAALRQEVVLLAGTNARGDAAMPGETPGTMTVSPGRNPRTSNPDANFPQAEVLEILALLQQKDFAAAIDAGNGLQFRAPDSLAPLRVLATIYLAAGQPEQAKDVLHKVLQRAPGDPVANRGLAQLALQANDTAAARHYYRSILDLHPDDLTTTLQLAALDARKNDPQAMLAQLNAATAAHPDALEPRLWLASYHIGSGAPEKVEPVFSTLTALQRQAPRVLELTAMAQLALGNNADALQTLQRLVEARPNSADAHYLLAMAANASGDAAQTRRQLQAAAELNPRHVLALVGLAKIARLEGQQQVFEEKLATLQDIAPDVPDVLRLRALSAHLQGDSQRARLLSQQAFERAPSNESLLELTALRKTTGQFAQARAGLESWLATHPDDNAVRLTLANTLEEQHELPAAQLHYLAVLQRDPANITALNNLAWNLREKDPAQALAYIRKALAIAPEVPVLLDTQAMVESAHGDHVAARNSLERALQRAPQDPTLRLHEAMLAAARGDKAQAISALEALLPEYPAGSAQRAEAEALLKSWKG